MARSIGPGTSDQRTGRGSQNIRLQPLDPSSHTRNCSSLVPRCNGPTATLLTLFVALQAAKPPRTLYAGDGKLASDPPGLRHSKATGEPSSGQVLVGFLQHIDHVLPGSGLSKKANKAFVLQMPRDILQCSEMISRLVLWRNEQEKDSDRFAVKGREIDTSTREGDRPDQPCQRGVASMGNGNPHPDSGRAQLLASEDRSNHALDVTDGEMASLVQASNHLPDCFCLTCRLQINNNGISNHEIR